MTKRTQQSVERTITYIDAQLAMYKANEVSNLHNYVCIDKFGRCACMAMDGTVFVHHALHPMQFSDIQADDVCQMIFDATGERLQKMHPKQYYQRKRAQLQQLLTSKS